jgi:hypothetical protein
MMQTEGHHAEPPPLLTDVAREMTGIDFERSPREHPSFQRPDSPDQVIWRYMDFTKFVSMVDHRALFLARIDLLGDPFEGATPRANVLLRTALAATHDLPADTYEALGAFLKWSRKWTFVNCWHMNDTESAAMWRLYSKSEEAIAIKSTFGLLDKCIGDRCHIGQVKYLDYDADADLIEGWDALSPFVHKRKSFEHEKELRVLLQTLPKMKRSDGLPAHDLKATAQQTGCWVETDLAELIVKVFTAPQAEPWFRDLVESVCRKYGLVMQVRQSRMDSDPMY